MRSPGWRSETAIPLDGYSSDGSLSPHDPGPHCSSGCQTPRKPRHPLESQPRPRSSQRFRPGGSSSLQGCCNHLPTNTPGPRFKDHVGGFDVGPVVGLRIIVPLAAINTGFSSRSRTSYSSATGTSGPRGHPLVWAHPASPN